MYTFCYGVLIDGRREKRMRQVAKKRIVWCWCLIRYNYKGIPHQTILKLEEEKTEISWNSNRRQGVEVCCTSEIDGHIHWHVVLCQRLFLRRTPFVVLLYKFPSARLSNYFHRAESVLLPTDSAPMRAVAALLMLSRLFVFQINYKAKLSLSSRRSWPTRARTQLSVLLLFFLEDFYHECNVRSNPK